MPLGGDSSILVPVDVSDDDSPAQPLVDLCRSVDVVLLGYYPVPDQVAPAQLRQDYESEATATLAEMADGFRASGIDITDVLVFTHDRTDTIDRVANEHGCDAVLTPSEVERIERVLVPVRGDTNLERIVSLLAGIMRMSDVSVTFFHSVAEDSDPSHGEFLVRGAVDRLDEAGIDFLMIEPTPAAPTYFRPTFARHRKDASLSAAFSHPLSGEGLAMLSFDCRTQGSASPGVAYNQTGRHSENQSPIENRSPN